MLFLPFDLFIGKLIIRTDKPAGYTATIFLQTQAAFFNSSLKSSASIGHDATQDEHLMQSMGTAARKRVIEVFSWEKVVDNLLNEYNKICDVNAEQSLD